MTHSFVASTLVGALQVTVPSYGLRLNRLFGSRRVGRALVVAFLALALLNLAGEAGSPGGRQEWELARTVVAAVIPVLLLIGLAQVEKLLKERARVEREQRVTRCELEQSLDRRTEALAELKEEFHRQLSRRDQAQRALAQKVEHERLELGVRVAAKAGQRLNRYSAVIDLYAKLLLAKHSEPGTTPHHQRLAATAAEARALGRQLLASGCSQPLQTHFVSLSDLVRRRQPALQQLLGEHGLLECICPPDTPLVWADPALVDWMLRELVRNARDAMAERGSVTIGVPRHTECPF